MGTLELLFKIAQASVVSFSHTFITLTSIDGSSLEMRSFPNADTVKSFSISLILSNSKICIASEFNFISSQDTI
jgi:hypothetical protein